MALENEGRRADLSSPVAKAGADYQGDGLAVTATTEGARLRCVFQKLDGEATSDGLWLTSTVFGQPADRFRVKAVALARDGRAGSPLPAVGGASVPASRFIESGAHGVTRPTRLPPVGEISVDGQMVRFVRPGLVEEYAVSLDGVRQDFVVLERPAPSSRPSPPVGEKVAEGRLRGMPGGNDELRVELAVTGARVEPTADGVHPVRYAGQAVDQERGKVLSHGARLVLEESGRKIAYSRLRVTDANGKELSARMEVASGILPDVEGVHPAARNDTADFLEASLPERPESAGLEAPALRQAGMPAATSLAVLVDDAQAVYPIRIDPTFSDANWVSMGGIPGADDSVRDAVTDGAGNLYIVGDFAVVGEVVANRVAKWDGNSWSPLGSGIGGTPYAIAASGSDVYVGGSFTTAGGNAATNIAKWNGNSWSPLSSGMDGPVLVLATSGTNVYAGGWFKTAGGNAATNIAIWNGSSWAALGSGMNS